MWRELSLTYVNMMGPTQLFTDWTHNHTVSNLVSVGMQNPPEKTLCMLTRKQKVKLNAI